MSREFTPRHAQTSIDVQNTALSSGRLDPCRVTTAGNNSIQVLKGDEQALKSVKGPQRIALKGKEKALDFDGRC